MLPQFVSGSPLLEAAWAVGTFVVFVLAAWLIYVIMQYIERRQKAKGKARLLPQLLISLHRPIVLLMVSEGIILALYTPSRLASWHPILQDVSIVVAIVITTYGVARFLGALVEWYAMSPGVRRKVRIDVSLARLLRRIVLLVMYMLGVLILMDYLNIEISPLVASLGIGGIAVALALQPTLANFFAGTQIVSDRVVRVGDYIELESSTRGYVVNVGWRSTRIRTSFNNMVIIPNSRLAESIITNYYGPTMEISVIVYCGVSYDSDLAHVEQVALDVAKEVIADLDEAVKAEPWFGFEDFGESNINFWLWLQAVDRVASFRVTSELVKRLHARLRKEGITINYPVRRLVYDEQPPPLPGSQQ